MSAEQEKTAAAVGVASPENEAAEAPPSEKDQRTGNSEDDVKVDINLSDDELVVTDIFKPLPPLEGVPAEPHPLTMRAVLVGVLLGSLVNASNVYLGECLPQPANAAISL